MDLAARNDLVIGADGAVDLDALPGVEALVGQDGEVLGHRATAVEAARVAGHGLEVRVVGVGEARLGLAAGDRELDHLVDVEPEAHLVELASAPAVLQLLDVDVHLFSLSP